MARVGKAEFYSSFLSQSVKELLLCSILGFTSGSFANGEIQKNYQVEKGTLGQILSHFTFQSGIALSFDPAITQGKMSSGLNGRYTAEQGIQRLIKNTGLRLVKRNDQSWQIVEEQKKVEINELIISDNRGQAEFTQLPTVIVNAEPNYNTFHQKASLSHLDLDQQHTPQSISIVDQEQIKSQNLQTVAQALNSVPGITTVNYGDGSSYFKSRGYDTDIQYDGLPANDSLQYINQFDLAYYDRVEVQRGAAGILQGFGNPGGTVNLVRKKPTEEYQLNGSAGIGSWQNARTTFEVSGPLDTSKQFTGLFGTALRTQNSFRDYEKDQHGLLYAALSGNFTDQTVLTVGGAYQHNRDKGIDYGTSLYSNGMPVNAPISASFGLPWSYISEDISEVYAVLDHQINEKLKTQTSIKYRENDYDSRYGYIMRRVNLNNTANYWLQAQNVNTKWYSADSYVDGKFNWLDQEQQFVLGINYDHYNKLNQWGGKSGGVVDIFNIHIPETNIPFLNSEEIKTQQYGAYGQFLLKPVRDFSIILGGKQIWYKLDNSNLKDQIGKPTLQKFNPYVAFTYDITTNMTSYISYNSIFSPSSDTTYTGVLLKPREGEQFEVGVKTQLVENLSLNIAAYQLKDENRPKADPINPNFSVAIGKARTRGVDVLLEGNLSDNWKVNTGYTYLDSKVLDTDTVNKIQDVEEPKHSFKLWTTYALPYFNSPGTYIGAAFRAQSKTSRDASNPYWQKNYTVTDVLLGYQVDPNLNLSMNINNIFNEKYYTRVPSNFFGLYGEPRNVMLTLRYNYK
ncbi:TonB-dependent siderophore receptor [Acinetobacter sp. ANC 4558]|uniref:TonB-dependent siderophore receptor n=1 Tax=Acinetobacter sp. ANC 4558 TaxID=1977876 RepID=UPI00148AAAE7|nr:TonB-dependent receptor [Acinetobacter sp. ANC 4558]